MRFHAKNFFFQGNVDIIESNFTRWANYYVGIAVVAALCAAAFFAVGYINR
jgi:hypothetical protein